VGHSVGETFQAQAQGEPVTVTIRQASRTVFPEPTDEMAAAYAAQHEGFAEIKTVAEYRQKVTEEYQDGQRKGALFAAMNEIHAYVLSHSDWEFDEDELYQLIEKGQEEFRESLAEEGKSLDTMTAEQLIVEFGVNSLQELEDVFQENAEYQIATDLWLEAINGCPGEEMENPWAFLEEYVRENLTMEED
jgi:PHD/YefM family antitoxin component YafN of YafNO toxin-antitoxin module